MSGVRGDDYRLNWLVVTPRRVPGKTEEVVESRKPTTIMKKKPPSAFSGDRYRISGFFMVLTDALGTRRLDCIQSPAWPESVLTWMLIAVSSSDRRARASPFGTTPGFRITFSWKFADCSGWFELSLVPRHRWPRLLLKHQPSQLSISNTCKAIWLNNCSFRGGEEKRKTEEKRRSSSRSFMLSKPPIVMRPENKAVPCESRHIGSVNHPTSCSSSSVSVFIRVFNPHK